MADMEFTEIYIKGNPKMINHILAIARGNLGEGVDAIDLHPQLVEDKE